MTRRMPVPLNMWAGLVAAIGAAIISGILLYKADRWILAVLITISIGISVFNLLNPFFYHARSTSQDKKLASLGPLYVIFFTHLILVIVSGVCVAYAVRGGIPEILLIISVVIFVGGSLIVSYLNSLSDLASSAGDLASPTRAQLIAICDELLTEIASTHNRAILGSLRSSLIYGPSDPRDAVLVENSEIRDLLLSLRSTEEASEERFRAIAVAIRSRVDRRADRINSLRSKL